jgi:Restriction endonuclease
LSEIDAQVTWNDRIADPDNPERERQIDITIGRSNGLTLVECRKHASPQDVTWVEELYGRRISLRADSIIGVSASGFTDGAKRKAERLGVILRDFSTVTPEEARRWGEPSILWIVFYEFRNFTIWLDMPATSLASALTQIDGRPIIWRELLIKLTENYDLNTLADQFVSRNGTLAILVDGVKPRAAKFKCRLRGRKREIKAPSVGIYSNPIDQGSAVEARVDQFSVGESEVIKGPELASIIIDLSAFKIPDRSIFGTAGISQQGGIRVRDFQIVGASNILESKVDISLRFGR